MNINYPIIQKLALIKIILPKYDPIEKYGNYKKLITDINKSHNDKKKKKKSKQEMDLISKEKDIDAVASVMNGNNLINREVIDNG